MSKLNGKRKDKTSHAYTIKDVSIIIPCKTMDYYAKRCVNTCRILYPEAELLIITDNIVPGYPSDKRNYAMKHSKREIFAFIDSDAYPSMMWLHAALEYLNHYPAVCGPGMLPPDAPTNEIVADLVLQAMPYSYRVIPRKNRLVPEYPTFNLLVQRDFATQFEDYLTGEDSLFCRKIEQGIFYHPDILVFHNRRPAFRPLWKQLGTYGRHRGYLIRKAFFAWISSGFVYASNFIIGVFGRKPS